MSFHGYSRSLASSEIAYLPQRTTVDWDFPITVRGMVEMGRYQVLGWRKRFREDDRRAVDQALEAMELEDLGHRQISALSGGQQQRAFLARALAQQAHVFLLDEPFTGLDKPSHDGLSQLFHELRAEGKLIIASHHDLQSVPHLFDQVLLLNGELIASGPAAETLTNA